MKTIGVLCFVAALLLIFGAGQLRDESPTQTKWTEPYGGCKEAADYPGTPGYIDCVEHGWNPPE